MANAEATLLVRIKEAGAEALGKVKAGLDEVGKASAAMSAALTAALGYSVKAFGESEQATNKLSQAIANQGLDVDKLMTRYGSLAEAIMKKSKFDDDEIKSAIASGQAMAGNIALTDELIRATVDFAAAKEMDLKTAFDLVGKSIGTETNALARYGVALDTSATKSQKMQTVTDALNGSFGGFADTMSQDVNSSVIKAGNALGELAESIGKVLAPFVKDAANAFTDLITAVSQNETLVRVGTIIAAVAAGVTGLIGGAAGLVAIWPSVTAGAAAVGSALSVLLGPIGLVAAAVAGLTTAWFTNFGEIQEVTFGVFGAIKDFWAAFTDDAARIFGGLAKVIKGGFTFDFDQIKEGISEITAKSKTASEDLAASYKKGFAERKAALASTLTEQISSEKKASDDVLKSNKAYQAQLLADRKKKTKEGEDNRVIMHDSTLGELRRADEEAFADELKRQEKLEEEKFKAAEKAMEKQAKAHQEFMDELGSYGETMITGGFQGIAEKGVTALTETLLPGFGGAAGQMFSLLSQDSDQFLETVNTLFSTKFLDNIAENIPVLIEAFADGLPGLIDKISERMPEIVERLIESLIENSPDIAVAMSKAFMDPKFHEAIVVAIAKGTVEGIRGAGEDVKEDIKKAFEKAIGDGWDDARKAFKGDVKTAFKKGMENAWNDIKDTFKIKFEEPGWLEDLKSATGGGGGGGGGYFDQVRDRIGFAKGGVVPSTLYAAGGAYVPVGTDTVPAMLTPGEFVVNARDSARNMDALRSINSGGQPGGTTINLNVYGGLLGDQQTAKQLAKALDAEIYKLRQSNQSVGFDSVF